MPRRRFVRFATYAVIVGWTRARAARRHMSVTKRTNLMRTCWRLQGVGAPQPCPALGFRGAELAGSVQIRPRRGAVMPQQPVLSADEQKYNDVWNDHLRAEFSAHSAEETLATM